MRLLPPPLCPAQSEYGDVYKVTLEYEDERVTELKIKYFDTIPPCTSICVLKTGFLFAASEFGNHALYQFQVRPQREWGRGKGTWGAAGAVLFRRRC